MDLKYNPLLVEEKWQKHWEEKQTFCVEEDSQQKKYYVLEMFPYPSGRIHMGHVRNYTIGDVVARYKKMKGFNVLHPMGWDAFGMPAENAAIQSNTHPSDWTYRNIEIMKTQLKRLGFSYDWSREFATCDPDYYKWEQKIFLKMLDKGLVYKKTSFVNWCSSCQTVLANEQVENGLCWRCRKEAEQKELDQWFFRITNYAEQLLSALDQLTGWPERVIAMQRNWIGKSHGTEIEFTLEDSEDKITVFTTRPDTLFGATFMSLAPENPLVKELAGKTGRYDQISSFVDKVLLQDKTVRTAKDIEKEGMFTGSYCINPLTGYRMPVYVANFVLMEYGTGAVMAVPAHDQRDFEFAKKYGLDIKVVIQPEGESLSPDNLTEAYQNEGTLVNSGDFNGMKNTEAMDKITSKLSEKQVGRKAVNYRLKDWGISRQRYWGNPIPVVYCQSCGMVKVPEEKLPVVLPRQISLNLLGQSPLAQCDEFVNTTCPACGCPAKRETDTMDTFVESSWYFARYTCPDSDKEPLDREKVKYWLPVDQYIGGIEHAVLHLLYARFFTKVLRDIGFLDVDEPFTNLLTQGMVCMETSRCGKCGWLYPEETENGLCKKCLSPVILGRKEKMSKSTKNVIDPENLIARYGADTARLFCLFAAPPELDLEWSEKGVEGSFRFLQRIWRLTTDNIELIKTAAPVDFSNTADEEVKSLRRKTHQTIKKVTEDIEDRFHFNTAISAVMELLNIMYQFDLLKNRGSERLAAFKEALETVILLLSPMVPHICEELWEMLGEEQALCNMRLPDYDPEAAKEEELEIAVQVNGKLRGRIVIPADLPEEQIKQQAQQSPQVLQWIEGKNVKKIIVVPGRLVSIVVA